MIGQSFAIALLIAAILPELNSCANSSAKSSRSRTKDCAISRVLITNSARILIISAVTEFF